MPATYPPSLRRLLAPASEGERDDWTAFLEEHSKLILHVANRAAEDHDEVMDRYTYVLARLREDDYRRLRAYSPNGSGKFTTWLVVVVRRLCIDHRRKRVGRDEARMLHPDAVARRGLAGLLVEKNLEPDQLPAPDAGGPDTQLIRRQNAEHLTQVLADLEPRDRLTLTLRYVDGHSPEKVARMLGYSSRFAVRRRVKFLLNLLRRRLENRGVAP